MVQLVKPMESLLWKNEGYRKGDSRIGRARESGGSTRGQIISGFRARVQVETVSCRSRAIRQSNRK